MKEQINNKEKQHKIGKALNKKFHLGKQYVLNLLNYKLPQNGQEQINVLPLSLVRTGFPPKNIWGITNYMNVCV